MGAAAPLRYMGGKTVPKYFKEDAWPMYENLFDILFINKEQAFELFRAFVLIDLNQNGEADVAECFAYIGGRATKFTKRVFYNEEIQANETVKTVGLKFEEFIPVLWNFCTFTYEGLARYVFEIMDVDNTCVLEREDIDTIYRMVYECPETENEVVAVYPFYRGKIQKDDFCRFAAKNPLLIQPVIDFQTRVRSRFGGKQIWEALTLQRRRQFYDFDTKSDTIAHALEAIIHSGDNRPPKTLTAEMKVELAKKKFEEDKYNSELEIRLRAEQIENDKKIQMMSRRDKLMIDARNALERAKKSFDGEEFLIADAWKRREARLQLFALFDSYVVAAKQYWEWKNEKDVLIAEGTDADHEARFQDWVKVEPGLSIYRLKVILEVFREQQRRIVEQNERNKKKSKFNKSEKEMLVEANFNELSKVYSTLSDPLMKPEALQKLHDKLKLRFYEEEKAVANRFTNSKDWAAAEALSHTELCSILKEKTITTTKSSVETLSLEREKEFVREDFALATKYGSRITRYRKRFLCGAVGIHIK
jgi:hypothetical protein